MIVLVALVVLVVLVALDALVVLVVLLAVGCWLVVVGVVGVAASVAAGVGCVCWWCSLVVFVGGGAVVAVLVVLVLLVLTLSFTVCVSTTSETTKWHTLVAQRPFNSRRQRHSPARDNEELFVVEGSLKNHRPENRDSMSKWTESEKWRKMRPKPASKSSMTETEAPPTVSGNCANSSLRDHGDVHTLSMNCKKGHRPLWKYCNCGTSTVFSTG